MSLVFPVTKAFFSLQISKYLIEVVFLESLFICIESLLFIILKMIRWTCSIVDVRICIAFVVVIHQAWALM